MKQHHKHKKPDWFGSLFAAGTLLASGQALSAGGDFANTDFSAAAPFTYDHKTGGGAYNDRTTGDFNDITEQLEGGEFTCGDIVTYLAQIQMESTTVDPVQTAEFDFRFLGNSTGQRGAAHIDIVGVAVNYGQVENGDDGTGNNPGAGSYGLDSGITDDGDSTASLVSESFVGTPFQSGGELLGTVQVDNLEPGEEVVMRIDVKLACDPGTSPTGNLQGQLDGGRVVYPDGTTQTINTGQQTIPFLKVGDIAGAGEPLLSFEKTVTTANGTCGVDDVEELTVSSGDSVTYCYALSNSGTADLYNVEIVDDNGTAGDTSDDVTIVVGTLPAGETTTVTGSDTLYNGGNETVTISPDATAVGDNGLNGGNYSELTASDGVIVQINAAPNQPPVANDDAASVDENGSVTINLAGNDTDPEGNLDNTSVSIVSGPANGTLINNGDGTVTYNPATDFSGEDSFTYSICDAQGLCDDAIVDITVNSVSEPPGTSPPVANNDSAQTQEDMSVDINAAANDTDVDGDLDPSSATVVSEPTHGTVVNNNDGTFSYTPNENFYGSDQFSYQICDLTGECSIAVVNIVVDSVNDAPVAEDDSATTVEDEAISIPVNGNDSDLDGNLDILSALVTTEPSNGSVTKDEDDGSLIYTPNANFNGSDSFEYEICDTAGLCDTALVTVNVTPVNDLPVAEDDNTTVAEDEEVTIAVTENDSDVDGNPLTVSVNTDPSNGSVMVNADGTMTYTPNPDYNGSDSFTYTISDGNGGEDTATVTIEVTPVNDIPVANGDSANVDEDGNVTIPVLDNDSDVDGDTLTVGSVTEPANGSVSINSDSTVTYTPDANYCGSDSFEYTVMDTNGGSATTTVDVTVACVNDAPLAVDDTVATDEDAPVDIAVLGNDSDVDGDTLTVIAVSDPGNGSVTINADGTLTYSPDANFNGTDSFTYTVSDGNGGIATATVTVPVASLNDAPVADDDALTTDEDTPATIDVAANDSDVDGNLVASTASLISSPTNGSLVNNGDGTFSYTPNENFHGADSFIYKICDAEGLCDDAKVNITVNSVNDAPVAVDDDATTLEDSPVTITALANDSDVDGDTLTVTTVSDPASGTVSINTDGTLVYTPNTDFNGTDTFTYTVSDGNGGTATATVTVDVTSVNDAPAAADDWATTPEDSSVTINAMANDSDVDGDTLTVTAVSDPANGSVSINSDGTVTYTPNPDYNGADSFTYTVGDDNGGAATATVTVDVSPVNDAPVAADDAYNTTQDTVLIVEVAEGLLDNDSDVDGDTLAVSTSDTSSQYGGDVFVNTDGSFDYDPAPGFAGYDTFSYEVCDEGGLCDTGTATVEVQAKNNRSISVDLQGFTLNGANLDGYLVITNQSGNYDVQVTDLDITVQYRSREVKQWTTVAVAEESCLYDPELTFLVMDSQPVSFQGCALAEDVDLSGASVRVTANVKIYGRFKGKKAESGGWFLSRLSK